MTYGRKSQLFYAVSDVFYPKFEDLHLELNQSLMPRLKFGGPLLTICLLTDLFVLLSLFRVSITIFKM